MRRVSFRLGVFVLLCLGTAAGVGAQQGTIIQRILVKVNGEPFSQKELESRQIETLQRTGRDKLQGAELTAALTEMMPELLVKAVDDLLLLQRGKDMNYHMTNEQFDAVVDGIKNDNGMTDAEFKTALESEGLTLDVLRKRIEPEFIIREVQRNEVLGAMRLTEQELHQYYDAHPDEFMKTPTVTLRELLVAAPAAAASGPGRAGQPTFAPAPNEQALTERIESLRQRAAGGEDFQKIVEEASDAPSKATGGLIGPIDVTELSAAIRDAIEKLQPGDVTPPIRTPRGYQLLKLESRTTAQKMPFDEVRDQIEQKVGESRLDAETAKYLRIIRTQALLDWKRDDLRLMYEKRIAERAAAAPTITTAPSSVPVNPTRQ
jgi:peptidyl-prolyl cis-trans isomerase SurA